MTEEERKKRLAVYFGVASKIWPDRMTVNMKLRLFCAAKFGNPSLKYVPNDPEKDKMLIDYLERERKEKGDV